MNLLESPTRIFDLGNLRRYCGGKPPIEKIAWFRDHVYWHRNAIVDADNISFTLEEDPGEKRIVENGIEVDLDGFQAPLIGCAYQGLRITTLATVRRNELLFRYRHADMTIPEYPFPRRHFVPSAYFWKLFRQFSDHLDHLQDPGIADQQDLLALQMIAEALAFCWRAEEDRRDIDPRIYRIANRIASRPDEEFNIKTLAADNGFSRAAFYREWSKYSRDSPYHLLLENRLRIAEAFLSSTLLPVKDIAFRSGFRNITVFTAAFKNRFGMPPREYRERKSGTP